MEFLARGYEALRGPQGAPQSATDTILKLTDRLAHGTLLEDRRAAVLGLKGLSRDWKLEVGRASLPGLIQALENPTDRQDVEMCKAVLETLNVLCLRDEPVSPVPDSRWPVKPSTDVGAEFSDALIGGCSITELILEILLDHNFYVRWFALQLLTTLLSNRSTSIQEGILSAPGGCGRLMEMLLDRREVIRNEALLLLIALTESNADIQKIIAFENAFQVLFDLIVREDGVAGGIVVQDCLVVIGNLLRYNVSNQNFFRETSCIQRLPEVLGYDRQYSAKTNGLWQNQEWPDQKIINVRMVLSIIKLLLVPGNLSTAPNQRALLSSGLVQAILEMALVSNAPSRVKTIALYLLADSIRGLKVAQDFLLHAVVASAPNVNPSVETSGYADGSRPSKRSSGEFSAAPKISLQVPALIPLIETALGKTSHLLLSQRAAACYAIECLLHENPDAQLIIMSTMTPPPATNPNDTVQSTNESAGSLILAAITEADLGFVDPYTPWFACTLLAHILKDNEKAKRIARNITFGDSEAGEESVSLVQTVLGNFMMHSGSVQSHVNGPENNRQDVHPSIGYLCLLCMWLWDSPKTVKELLSEGSNLQLLVTSVTQSSGMHPLVQGLCAYLLGICYEYHRNAPIIGNGTNGEVHTEEKEGITRATMQPILLQRIGVDQFINRITRLRESPAFRDASPELHVIDQSPSLRESRSDLDTLTFADALPDLLFDHAFVEQLKTSYLAIQRAITVDPAEIVGEPRIRRDPELLAEVQRLRERVIEQDAELETLNTKVNGRETEVDREHSLLLQEVASLSEQVKQLREELDSTQSELALAKTSASKSKTVQNELSACIQEKTALQSRVKDLEAELSKEKAQAEEALRDKEDFAMLLEDTISKRTHDKARLKDAGLEVSDTEGDQVAEEGEE